MDKVALRKRMLDLRDAIPDALRKEKSRAIADSLLKTKSYRLCDGLFCFVSMGSEPATSALLEQALSDGKTVACPFAVPKTRMMHFIKITSLDGMVRSKYGVMEPLFDEGKIIRPTERSVIIVPGLAFDRKGYRIGYGGGYYDTYFENNPQGYRLGISFGEMLMDNIPRQPHDKPIDMLITDKEEFVWKPYK